MIPFEELAFSPNREPAERLSAIVGRRFVFSRDAWPAWDRLVERFTWPVVVKAADKCDPTKRFPNNVEAMCIELRKQEADTVTEHTPPRRPTGTAGERSALFASILKDKGLRS